MSWQPYVDDSLIGSGFQHACIASHEGQVWAASEAFVVKEKEVTRLHAALLGEEVAVRTLREHGFSVAGVSYTLSRLEFEDDDVHWLIGRCKETGERSRGVAVARTQRTLLFGVHDPLYARGFSFQQANAAMYTLAEMLYGMSF